MKREEAVAGRWIQSNLSDSRRRLVGETLSGDIVVELPGGSTALFKPEWLHQWDLLPTECDSFDWQPETFPQWYLPSNFCNETDVAYIVRESSTVTHSVFRDGRLMKWATDWKDKGQKQISEAEALALLDKKPEPVIPDGVYYCNQDMRGNFYDMKTKKGMGNEFWDKWKHLKHQFPRNPEPVKPVKPATRKVMLKEYAVWDDDTADMQLLWKSCWPVDWEHALETGNTREIEVPL